MSPKPDSENKKANAATDDATGAGHVSVVHRPTKSPFLLWTVFAIFYTSLEEYSTSHLDYQRRNRIRLVLSLSSPSR